MTDDFIPPPDRTCTGSGYRTTGEPDDLHCPTCGHPFGNTLTAPHHDEAVEALQLPTLPTVEPLPECQYCGLPAVQDGECLECGLPQPPALPVEDIGS